MNIRSVFTEPPEELSFPVIRYGLLLVIVGLLAFDTFWRFKLSPIRNPEHYVNTVVFLMLLFSHLAFQFRWPIIATVVLRVLACVWVLFAASYVSFVLFRAVSGTSMTVAFIRLDMSKLTW